MNEPTGGRVALTGFGSVGQALARILVEDSRLPLRITAVADRGGVTVDPDGLDPAELLAAKGRGSVATHVKGRPGHFSRAEMRASGAQVLLELASTEYEDGQPGWGYIQDAFRVGLDVVLASKGPLVAHWDELFALAGKAGRRVRYSATHGAPLPLIDLARVGLPGSRLYSVRALLNSTTGLLLERMEQGMSLGEAMGSILAAGVAETNPRLDVEGWDAAAKCVIVGRSLFGANLTLADVDREGIGNLTAVEVMEASRQGTPIKLLCAIEPGRNGISASVTPRRLAPDDPLANLRDGALGIVYEAEPVGRMFLAAYGRGGRATAAAVIRDVLGIGTL